ncbi:MAG: hypothetical protein PHH54_04115 [Candidatus Nanoarchaeia archaeon]|nr:hypothetical protein [Candidatus Nanoarchaeia archaeon]MDD5741145.1 hypothetical protein [Candidatus Nanoarchaeia archaeon]
MAEPQQDPISSLFSEFSTRLNEIEEKQRLIKDRILLVGENLISTKEDYAKHEFEIKRQLKQISSEISYLKQLMSRVVNEMPNLAKKSELEILERQAQIFQPLELARIKDVKDIVKEEINKQKK